MYLILDTSTRYGAVGLWRDGTLVRSSVWRSGYNHTAELMPAIDALLNDEGRPVGSVRGIGVASGPGGFSALRAGLGVAKGLALALGVPVVGVSTLEASAHPHRGEGLPVCAVLEAGRELVAWARFQQTPEGWRRRTPDRVTPVDSLMTAMRRHTLFCGEGTTAHGPRLVEAMGARAHLAMDEAPHDRLRGVAELASARLDAGDTDPVATLQPRYLRPPGITPPKAPKPLRYGSVRRSAGR